MSSLAFSLKYKEAMEACVWWGPGRGRCISRLQVATPLLVLHSGVMKVSIIYLAFYNSWMDVFFCNVFCTIIFFLSNDPRLSFNTLRDLCSEWSSQGLCRSCKIFNLTGTNVNFTLFQTRFHRQAILKPLNPDPTYVYFGR
jgi:hypothetical protein